MSTGLPQLRGVRDRVEPVLQLLDRVGGGRLGRVVVGEDARTAPATRRTFAVVTALLGVVLVLGVAAELWSVDLDLTGHPVSGVVRYRLFVIVAITLTLFYFVWRARRGYLWAYSRLRLFSIVFPVATSAIPGLYPRWMIIEQVAVSAVLLLVARQLYSPHMRAAYARPDRR